jgi:DNA-binding response OmpR family regulator
VVLEDRKALLVEDEPMIADLLREMLVELGCGSISLESTLSGGLHYLESHTPDVAILDIHLGTELSGPIAARLRELKVPFVVSSGFPLHELSERKFDTIFLSLPYSLDTLEAALVSVLRHKARGDREH